MKYQQGLDVTPSGAHEGEDGLPAWQHDDESIAFFRGTANGKVHVRGRFENAETYGAKDAQASANLYFGKVVALCGKKVVWHKAGYLSCFPDDLLCRGCHDKFPADTNLLFEHETP